MQRGQRRRRPRRARRALPRVARRAAVDGLEGQGDPAAVVVGAEQPREERATAAAPPRPPPRAGAGSGESGLSSAPTAFTKIAAAGRTSEHRRRPGREPTGEVAGGDGWAAADAGRPRLHRLGHPGPRKVDAGRRGGGCGHEAAGPAAASASSMLSTRRRADSALSSTATRAPGPASRVGEVDVERVVERRVERMVEVDAGRGDTEPPLRSLGAAGDVGGDREVGAHGQDPAR